MRRIIFLAASALVFAGVGGCQKDDKSMEAALGQINEHLKEIDKKVDKIANAPAARGRPELARKGAGKRGGGRPPGPDPSAVYSVPVEGAAFKGAKNAKITVIEAFEFA